MYGPAEDWEFEADCKLSRDWVEGRRKVVPLTRGLDLRWQSVLARPHYSHQTFPANLGFSKRWRNACRGCSMRYRGFPYHSVPLDPSLRAMASDVEVAPAAAEAKLEVNELGILRVQWQVADGRWQCSERNGRRSRALVQYFTTNTGLDLVKE